MQSYYLEGIAVKFYRGIGAETQYISPFSKMNYFIGANNSGKSIVLNLLADRVSGLINSAQMQQLKTEEEYRGAETGKFFLALGLKSEDLKDRFYSYVGRQFKQRSNSQIPHLTRGLTDWIVDLFSVDGMLWLEKGPQGEFQIHSAKTVSEVAKINPEGWHKVWRTFQSSQGGSAQQHWVPQTMAALAKCAAPIKTQIRLIPAKRQLGEKGEELRDLSGRGLIDHLATLQNPSFDKQDDRERFSRINEFLREITGKPEAQLEVPSGREHLLVHMDNKVLPLHSLGTGIHEVVLIAAFCTIYDKSIMCIEEPEIHLHPLLQRKLVEYLMHNTSSQYFIATHSPSFIDSTNSSVFHVRNNGSQTHIRSVITKKSQRKILDDLGCHASDFLQSNAVIWVEGPSDRIYVKHWLRFVDEELEEGVHYSVMFYGGGLIRHLTASDEALSDFIRLRDLNRNMAIIMDSDLGSPEDELKPHVKRISTEMSGDRGVVWITAGREIENYIDGDELQTALSTLHPRLFLAPGKTGRFDHAFHFWRQDPENPEKRKTYKDGDKVGAANIICQNKPNLDILDLRERINEVALMIRKANGL